MEEELIQKNLNIKVAQAIKHEKHKTVLADNVLRRRMEAEKKKNKQKTKKVRKAASELTE
jgi:hypothetical protein